MNEKKYLNCEIVCMGILTPDHDGIGTAFTDFDSCVQGIGDTQWEAADDALEQAAQIINIDEYDLSEVEENIRWIKWEEEYYGDKKASESGDDCYYYAAFRWQEEKNK